MFTQYKNYRRLRSEIKIGIKLFRMALAYPEMSWDFAGKINTAEKNGDITKNQWNELHHMLEHLY